jgi:glycosyltransferase involved in cell wall biosynthesis
MTTRKSILFIVPLSPPITGAALASENIIEYIRERHDVLVIPYQRGNLVSGKFSISQVVRIVMRGFRLLHARIFKRFDVVYLVISSSFWGNIRDLLFLLIMGRKMREKLVVHLHGANFDCNLLKASKLRKWMNRILFNRVKAGIVLGESFADIFEGYIARDKIKIIKNFFDPELLIPGERIVAKFKSTARVRILYLSNLMKEKGYDLLLDAFLSLPAQIKARAQLDFAGNINGEDKAAFLDRIRNEPNISYHGSVVGKEKRELFWESHIFCLPTFYKYEGQPISILEAYASGCFVLTTNNGGIKDIFCDGKQGLALNDSLLEIDIEKIMNILTKIITDIERCKDIAENNRLEAKNYYCKDTHMVSIERILVASN